MDNSPIASLPAELRNLIYELSLVRTSSVVLAENGTRLWRPPALLLCCSQIRAEASSIYYSGNDFLIIRRTIGPSAGSGEDINVALRSWLLALELENHALVRRIHLDDCLSGGRRLRSRLL